MGLKLKTSKRILQFSIISICLTGFLYQTIEFLFLYWTYPTVVDIQVSVPSKIEVPGITFCSSNGINPEVICSLGDFCLNATILDEADYCSSFPVMCYKGKVSGDFNAIMYNKFTTSQNINSSMMTLLRKPLNEFFKCQISSGKEKRICNTDDAVMGSYFSSTNIFNFCFTLNSLWSQPHKKTLKVKKSEKIEMEFYIDISYREKNISSRRIQLPRYSYPSIPSIQLVAHSPFLTASPFVSGHEFVAGKEYKMQLKQEESHLLPPPYQTNCTNYKAEWLAKNGVAPLNERMVVEECKYKNCLEEMECVPFTIDYPHNETVCKYCEECSIDQQLVEKCTKLQQIYNQPCDFVTYRMDVEEKLIYFESRLVVKFPKVDETLVEKIKGHNCSGKNIWSKNCQTVKIELVFDDFEITNLTYNPKFEDEWDTMRTEREKHFNLLNVIGGYMGMYLGVSIVAVYDFIAEIITIVNKFMRKKRKEKTKAKLKSQSLRTFINESERSVGFGAQTFSRGVSRHVDY